MLVLETSARKSVQVQILSLVPNSKNNVLCTFKLGVYDMSLTEGEMCHNIKPNSNTKPISPPPTQKISKKSPWNFAEDSMPDDLVVVLVEFEGWWSSHGNGGIRDAYSKDQKWCNIPERIKIVRWMYIPD